MKALAFAQRLLRDLKEKDLATLDASARLELLDAINGALQKLHLHSAPYQRTAAGAIYLPAPSSVTLDLTAGSGEFSGFTPSSDHIYCTIRIEGDTVDNQIVGDGQLLHAYGGQSGSHTAIIYGDAAIVPEPYAEILSDPKVLETCRYLTHERNYEVWRERQRSVTEPCKYWVEGNALSQNSIAPSIFRVDSLPDRSYRLAMDVLLAPARVSFTDILAPGKDLPVREEQIESFLLPIARGILSSSELWRDKDVRSSVKSAAENAEASFALLSPKTNATPRNFVGTPAGY